MMRSSLRVHVVPIGFDNQRVTTPILQSKADKVYLVSREADDIAAKYVEAIKKELKRFRVEIKEEFTDIWDLMACMEKFREIVIRERGNQLFFNVSTGSTLASIATMLTCMIWKCEPYYAKLKYSEKKPVDVQNQEVESVFPIPVYKILSPKDRELLILSLIKDHKGRITKQALIEKLKDHKIIRPVTTDVLTIHAQHSQLNAILKPLIEEHYVEVEARGRRSLVKMTIQGENALKIFGEGVPIKPTEAPMEE